MPGTVKQLVSKVARSLGYRSQRGSSNWRKDFADSIHIIGLQKSRWGGGNYLEAGIWLRIFGPDESPKYYECHVRLRLDADCGLGLEGIDAALSEDDLWKMDPEERLRLISNALKRAEENFFNRGTQLDDLQRFLDSDHNLNLAIDKRVREFFDK